MKKEEHDTPSKNAQIEEFLSDRYEFRYNTVLHRAEYRPRGTVQHHRKRFLPTYQSCARLFPSLTADER